MSTIGWIVVAVVIVVVVLLALAAWRWQHRKKMTARAQSLREEARSHAPEVGQNRLEAREAEVRADAARLEAERARREAEAAQTALAQQEAAEEDRIREADRLDPAVDHEADGYRPTAPTVDQPGQPVDEDRHPTPGAHRGDDPGADRF
jgi:FtsZ-interacting cell division protein ZipA